MSFNGVVSEDIGIAEVEISYSGLKSGGLHTLTGSVFRFCIWC